MKFVNFSLKNFLCKTNVSKKSYVSCLEYKKLFHENMECLFTRELCYNINTFFHKHYSLVKNMEKHSPALIVTIKHLSVQLLQKEKFQYNNFQ